MLNAKVVMEVKKGEKGERVYQFMLDNDSPLGEVHDALHEMKVFVVERINEYNLKEKEAQAAKVQQPPKVVDITEG